MPPTVQRSAVFAVSVGTAAAVVYVVITVATGGTVGGAVGMAVLTGSIASVLTFVISRAVAARRHRETP